MHPIFVGVKGCCSNLCPDEKGTESSIIDVFRQNNFGSNLCPDEKGTESISNFLLYLGNLSSNLCPDEKGTESSYSLVNLTEFST